MQTCLNEISIVSNRATTSETIYQSTIPVNNNNICINSDNKIYKYHSDNSKNQNNYIQNETNNIAITAYNMAIEAMSYANANNNRVRYSQDRSTLQIIANHQYGSPFGRMAILIFNLAIQEMQLSKSPVIRITKLYSKLTNISKQCESRYLQDKYNFNDQILRLFSSKITFIYYQEENLNIFDFWWSPFKGNKGNITSGSTIVIGTTLYNESIKLPILTNI